MSFTDAEEEKLIDLVAGYPILYDVNHEGYRNPASKEDTWKIVGKKLNKSSDRCKRKWKAVRDGYQRFKKKHAFGSSEVPKNSKDKRHQLLSFLDSTSQDPLDDEAPEMPVPQEVPEVLIVPEYPDVQIKTEEIDIDSQSCEPEVSDNGEEDITEEIDDAEEVVPKKANKRRLKQRRRKETYEAVKKRDDDIELFIRHIGEVLRNLPPVEKAQAKKHLYAVLSNYEIMAARKLTGRRNRRHH